MTKNPDVVESGAVKNEDQKKPTLSSKIRKKCERQQGKIKKLEEELRLAMDLDVGKYSEAEETEKEGEKRVLALHEQIGELKELAAEHRQPENSTNNPGYWINTARRKYLDFKKKCMSTAALAAEHPYFKTSSVGPITQFSELVDRTIVEGHLDKSGNEQLFKGDAAIDRIITKGEELVGLLREEIHRRWPKEFEKHQKADELRAAILASGNALPRKYEQIMSGLREALVEISAEDFWKDRQYMGGNSGKTISENAEPIREFVASFIPEPGEAVGTINKAQVKPLFMALNTFSDNMRIQLNRHKQKSVVGRAVGGIVSGTKNKLACVLKTKTRLGAAAAIGTAIIGGGVYYVLPRSGTNHANPPAAGAPSEPGKGGSERAEHSEGQKATPPPSVAATPPASVATPPPAVATPMPSGSPESVLEGGVSVRRKGDELVFSLPKAKTINLWLGVVGSEPKKIRPPTKEGEWRYQIPDEIKNGQIAVSVDIEDDAGWKRYEQYYQVK